MTRPANIHCNACGRWVCTLADGVAVAPGGRGTARCRRCAGGPRYDLRDWIFAADDADIRQRPLFSRTAWAADARRHTTGIPS